jgi:prevent-host-death family protein
VTTGDYYRRVIKAVGIKELKARLSEYVRLVKKGDTILITERDEVVAEVRSAKRQRRLGGHLEDRLQALADTGEIARASLPKRGWRWKARGLGLRAGTSKALLDEIRADRRSD